MIGLIWGIGKHYGRTIIWSAVQGIESRSINTTPTVSKAMGCYKAILIHTHPPLTSIPICLKISRIIKRELCVLYYDYGNFSKPNKKKVKSRLSMKGVEKGYLQRQMVKGILRLYKFNLFYTGIFRITIVVDPISTMVASQRL